MNNLKSLKYKITYNKLNNQIGSADSDIKVKLDTGEWVPARSYQIKAFKKFKTPGDPLLYEEKPYDYDDGRGIKFRVTRIGNEFHGGIHIIRENGTTSPIMDFSDVQVFLLDRPRDDVEWFAARNYQTWAYIDFLYANDPIRKYKSRGTPGYPDHIEIPIDGLDPNIIFSMSRNDNGTVFYEKNDADRTRVRISDNRAARRYYYAYFRRMSEPDFGPWDGPIAGPPAGAAAAGHGYLPIPQDVEVSKTLNDNIMCVICNLILQRF